MFYLNHDDRLDIGYANEVSEPMNVLDFHGSTWLT